MPSDDWADWADWTTEALIDYEERLYDQEVAGENVWFERDQVVRELARRRREMQMEQHDQHILLWRNHLRIREMIAADIIKHHGWL